jgi:hypothetical protein
MVTTSLGGLKNPPTNVTGTRRNEFVGKSLKLRCSVVTIKCCTYLSYQSFLVFTFRRTAIMCEKRNDFISSVLVLGLVLTSVAEAVDPSLLGWWKFDEGSGSDGHRFIR